MQILGVIQRRLQSLLSRWRNLYYRALGVKLHGYTWMKSVEIPRNHSDIEISSDCALDRGVILLCSGEETADSKIFIGAHTYINRNSFLDVIESLRIGQDCAIGPGCYITDHDHGTDLNCPPLKTPMVAKPTKIGDRVWIGANATILKGVTIGDDAVIGAGSVVTKNVPAGAIVAGVPSKVLQYKTDKKSEELMFN